MKTKVTAKFVRESFPRIISVGYCGLSNLLSCMEPKWYTCGLYGWNADVYLIDLDTVIVTGYRPFGNFNGNPLSSKYEKLAEKTNAECRFGDYDKRREALRNLITAYVREVCGE